MTWKSFYNRVAVVLGTSKYLTGGGLNQYFQNRIDATVALYSSGKINQVIVSGDNATMSYNEPREMRRELLKRGSFRAIYSDYAGFRNSTRSYGHTACLVRHDSRWCHNVSKMNELFFSLIIILSMWLDSTPKMSMPIPVFKTRIREIFARLWCLFDVYIWERQPRFMGEQIAVE